MCPVCHKLQAIIVITAFSSIRVAFRMSYTSLEVHLSGGSDIHRLWHFILFTHLVSPHLISPTSIINQVFVDINGNSPIFFFTDFPALSQIFKGPVSMGPTISCTKVFICSLSCTTWKTSLEGRRDRLGTARTPKYLFSCAQGITWCLTEMENVWLWQDQILSFCAIEVCPMSIFKDLLIHNHHKLASLGFSDWDIHKLNYCTLSPKNGTSRAAEGSSISWQSYNCERTRKMKPWRWSVRCTTWE